MLIFSTDDKYYFHLYSFCNKCIIIRGNVCVKKTQMLWGLPKLSMSSYCFYVINGKMLQCMKNALKYVQYLIKKIEMITRKLCIRTTFEQSTRNIFFVYLL